MASAVETMASSIVTKLLTISSIQTVERDRVEAVSKSEGVCALVEIEGEVLEPFAGDCYTTQATLRSSATIVINLLSWSTTWMTDLDTIACDVMAKVRELRTDADNLRLTKREWTARATDTGFGVLSLSFEFDSVCSSSDLSKKF